MVFFFSSRRRHTRSLCDWSSDVCSSDLGRLAGDRIHERDFPLQRRRILEIGCEPFLRQRDVAIVPAFYFYNWKPRLLRPTRCDFTNRFSRSLGQRVPEIGGGGVGILMCSDVAVNAVAKNIFAKKTLEHPNE